jgi:hypothetical protein
VAFGHHHAGLVGVQTQRLLVRGQRFLLPQAPAQHRAQRDEIARRRRLDLEQIAGRILSLAEAPGVEKNLRKTPPDQRQVRGLPQGLAQQPFGGRRLFGGRRDCREPADRTDVTRLLLQYLAKDRFRRLQIAPGEMRARGGDILTESIGRQGAVEHLGSFGMLTLIHEDIAEQSPGFAHRAVNGQRAAQGGGRVLRTLQRAIQRANIRMGVRRVWLIRDRCAQRGDGLIGTVLRLQDERQDAQGLDIARRERELIPQQPLGPGDVALAQHRKRKVPYPGSRCVAGVNYQSLRTGT